MGRSAHAGIVARELGIAETSLYRWRSEQRHIPGPDSSVHARRQDELARLRRENETLKACSGVLREGISLRSRAIQVFGTLTRELVYHRLYDP
jgi:transposase-like protein